MFTLLDFDFKYVAEQIIESKSINGIDFEPIGKGILTLYYQHHINAKKKEDDNGAIEYILRNTLKICKNGPYSLLSLISTMDLKHNYLYLSKQASEISEYIQKQCNKQDKTHLHELL